MKIYKYPIDTCLQVQTINLPWNSILLHVGLDPTGRPCIWAQVDVDNPKKKELQVQVVGTGWDTPNNDWDYLGTFLQGDFVWHIYVK
jgi:hypothetical protein